MEKVKELPCHDNESLLLINSDWFMQPKDLVSYKESYKKWIEQKMAKVPRLLIKTINNFDSVDDCTVHAVSDLTDYSISTLNQRLKKTNLEKFLWMKPKYTVGQYFVLSRSSVVSSVDEERSLYQSTTPIAVAATRLGVAYVALSRIRWLAYSENHDKFCALLPLVEMPVSGKRHICNQKLGAFLDLHGHEGKPFISPLRGATKL